MTNMVPNIFQVLSVTRASIIRLVAVILLVANARTIFSEVMSNVALLVIRVPAQCKAPEQMCNNAAHSYEALGWNSNLSTLTLLDTWLTYAIEFTPKETELRLRRAEVQFALGHTRGAAQLLPPMLSRPVDHQSYTWLGSRSQSEAAARSRLLLSGHFEAFLMIAYQQANIRRWNDAVIAFRSALSLGGTYMQSDTHQAYFEALAMQAAEKASGEGMPGRQTYLAGKYFAQAGEGSQAELWLRKVDEGRPSTILSMTEQARASMYLGIVSEQRKKFDDAVEAYQRAIKLDATLSEPQMRLLMLTRTLGKNAQASQIADSLERQGPRYRLKPPHEVPSMPLSVLGMNGWTLEGYDFDEEAVDIGSQFELWLWWRAPVGYKKHPRSGIQVGKYWVQLLDKINLVPNGGFEWGVNDQSVPIGFDPLWGSYGDHGNVERTLTPGGTSNVLRLSGGTKGLAIISTPVPIDSRGTYLISLWIRSHAQWSIRIACPEPGQENVAVGMREVLPEQPWSFFTYMGPANIDRTTNICRTMLFALYGPAEWDRIVMVQLDPIGDN